jgi:hypothetical protein
MHRQRTFGIVPHIDAGKTTLTERILFSALAVQHEGQGSSEMLRIWFGTLAQPDARPASYGSPAGTLSDNEVGAGALHVVTWSPCSGFTAPVWTSQTMHPTTAHPRGASGVCGLLLADLLAASPQHPEFDCDELIVGTLSGDIIVYNADSMVELWRTHVHGAAGCYNSLRAEDLNGDGLKELYVAGSYGLWRFVQPGEQIP